MTSNDIQKAAEKAADIVSDMCGPALMSKSEALQFLESVAHYVTSMAECLHEELRDEDED